MYFFLPCSKVKRQASPRVRTIHSAECISDIYSRRRRGRRSGRRRRRRRSEGTKVRRRRGVLKLLALRLVAV